MQDSATYEYAIIRFVPKVERCEYFNVGVILYSKSKKYLGVKHFIDVKKWEAFSPETPLETIQEYLQTWHRICAGKEKHGIGAMEISDRFRWLAACRSTMIQTSKTHSGRCSDPEKELEEVFERWVL